MKVIAEVFSQGEEVVCGQIVDSNAAWLSQHLTDLGFAVKRHTVVGDDLDDLVNVIREIAGRADCCICTGGLGPTVDDLTAEAAAIAANQELRFDEVAMRQIEAYFCRRQRTMPHINRKQAYFPRQAIRIDNPIGSAPGFAMQIGRCWFVFLPGVPSEMEAMFSAVRPDLQARFDLKPANLITLRTEGIGESTIQQLLQDVALPTGVQLGFRAAPDEVQTKLLFPAGFPVDEMQRITRQLADRIGDYVFAVDGLAGELGGDLLAVIDRLMGAKNYNLASLETASGGLLAAKCQGRDWLMSAAIAKDSIDAAGSLAVRCKHRISVVEDDMAKVARRLANELQRKRGTQLALVQLFTGSSDDYHNQGRSIVLYNGLQTGTGYYQSRHRLSGIPQTKQNQAAMLSLDLLRRYLQDKCH